MCAQRSGHWCLEEASSRPYTAYGTLFRRSYLRCADASACHQHTIRRNAAYAWDTMSQRWGPHWRATLFTGKQRGCQCAAHRQLWWPAAAPLHRFGTQHSEPCNYTSRRYFRTHSNFLQLPRVSMLGGRQAAACIYQHYSCASTRCTGAHIGLCLTSAGTNVAALCLDFT
jgi:hypothetical protein